MNTKTKQSTQYYQFYKILKDKGINFESKNGGAHLIVDGYECVIDFWPSTGKFIVRTGPKGRGVFNMIEKYCIEQ